jgi:hypothetical protein
VAEQLQQGTPQQQPHLKWLSADAAACHRCSCAGLPSTPTDAAASQAAQGEMATHAAVALVPKLSSATCCTVTGCDAAGPPATRHHCQYAEMNAEHVLLS